MEDSSNSNNSSGGNSNNSTKTSIKNGTTKSSGESTNSSTTLTRLDKSTSTSGGDYLTAAEESFNNSTTRTDSGGHGGHINPQFIGDNNGNDNNGSAEGSAEDSDGPEPISSHSSANGYDGDTADNQPSTSLQTLNDRTTSNEQGLEAVYFDLVDLTRSQRKWQKLLAGVQLFLALTALSLILVCYVNYGRSGRDLGSLMLCISSAVIWWLFISTLQYSGLESLWTVYQLQKSAILASLISVPIAVTKFVFGIIAAQTSLNQASNDDGSGDSGAGAGLPYLLITIASGVEAGLTAVLTVLSYRLYKIFHTYKSTGILRHLSLTSLISNDSTDSDADIRKQQKEKAEERFRSIMTESAEANQQQRKVYWELPQRPVIEQYLTSYKITNFVSRLATIVLTTLCSLILAEYLHGDTPHRSVDLRSLSPFYVPSLMGLAYVTAFLNLTVTTCFPLLYSTARIRQRLKFQILLDPLMAFFNFLTSLLFWTYPIIKYSQRQHGTDFVIYISCGVLSLLTCGLWLVQWDTVKYLYKLIAAGLYELNADSVSTSISI